MEWDNIGIHYYQIPFSAAIDMVAVATKSTLKYSSVGRVM
jgi:hypothetical protein